MFEVFANPSPVQKQEVKSMPAYEVHEHFTCTLCGAMIHNDEARDTHDDWHEGLRDLQSAIVDNIPVLKAALAAEIAESN